MSQRNLKTICGVEIYHQSLNEIPSRKLFKPTAETAVGTDSRE
jgi:hypothetical protein